MTLIITSIVGLIGLVLSILPFIGLIIDLRKNGKIEDFIGVLGVILMLGSIFRFMPNITAATIYAFLLTPLLFIYLFLLRRFSRSKKEKKQDQILDD